MTRYALALVLLPYIIIAAIIDAPILLALLGGGEQAWEFIPAGLQAFFVLTMVAPVVVVAGYGAWRADSAVS
jgi:hypothetical protein